MTLTQYNPRAEEHRVSIGEYTIYIYLDESTAPVPHDQLTSVVICRDDNWILIDDKPPICIYQDGDCRFGNILPPIGGKNAWQVDSCKKWTIRHNGKDVFCFGRERYWATTPMEYTPL